MEKSRSSVRNSRMRLFQQFFRYDSNKIFAQDIDGGRLKFILNSFKTSRVYIYVTRFWNNMIAKRMWLAIRAIYL